MKTFNSHQKRENLIVLLSKISFTPDERLRGNLKYYFNKFEMISLEVSITYAIGNISFVCMFLYAQRVNSRGNFSVLIRY